MMGKKVVSILAIAAVLLSAAGCDAREQETGTSSGMELPVSSSQISASAQPVTEEGLLAQMSDAEKSWMGLTPEQYLQDFDALFQKMQENYPYIPVAERRIGRSLEELFQQYRGRVEACANDLDFFETVREFVNQMEFTGHLDVWGYRYQTEVAERRAFLEEFPEYETQMAPYLEKLDNPISRKNYAAMQLFYEELGQKVEQANDGFPGQQADSAPEISGGTGEVQNVQVELLRPDEVAYVKINAFDMGRYHDDREILLPFYEQVAGYPHLILDITDNGGGGMSYFDDLVVAPLVGEPLRVETYLLAKDGTESRAYLRIEEGAASGLWKPVSELPDLPNLNQEDLGSLDWFMRETYTVEPLAPGSGFQGKIWLLVGPVNYSSSEYAAMFSKASGFATLVGENTSGDGIGVEPGYLILPNSGIVVQYSPIYGVTSDGTGSEEFGTAPDIFSGAGETALEACLRTIG